MAVAVWLTATVQTQQVDRPAALRAQIDRIFKERAYAAPRFGPARWLPDGTAYAIVEQPKGGSGSEIARYDAATGARTVLLDSSRLVPPGRKTPLSIEDYAWSADGKRLLIFTNTQKVWRDNTRGDYWVLDVGSGELRQLWVNRQGSTQPGTNGAAPSGLMFAKFSPDATRAAYVQANNIYVESLDTGRVTALTTDGSETTINGTSDWVYEEELFLRDCFRWSPDGRRIAYWQFDTTGVGIFSLINDTASLYPTITRIPYPKVGTTNSAARIGIVSADGGKTRWLQTPDDPRNSYLASLEWIDEETVAMQQLNRLQNRNDFLVGDVQTGSVSRIFRDESKTWVEAIDDINWINDGRAFLWVSERDGWRHVYRVQVPSASGNGADPGVTPVGEATLLTRFDADVTDLVGLDIKQGWLYFRSSPSNATQRYLYRAPLDGSAPPERVTPGDQPGWHGYIMAPGGRLAFHTVSRFDTPPRMDVVELPSHKSLRTLTDPSALQAAIAPIVSRPVEFTKVEVGDGVSLDGWVLKPSQFVSFAEVSAHRVHLRGARVADCGRSMGWCDDALPPGACRCRLRRRQLRQSRHAGAEGRSVAESRVRDHRGAVVERAGGGYSRACVAVFVRGHCPHRNLGLERRWNEYVERPVPVPRRLRRRRVRRSGSRPAALRHDLPGALHGTPEGQRRGLQTRLGYQLR